MVTWYCYCYWYCDNDMMNSGHSLPHERLTTPHTGVWRERDSLHSLHLGRWRLEVTSARGAWWDYHSAPSHFDISLQGKIWTFEQTQWHFCWVHLIPIIAFLVSLANPMTVDPTFQRLVLATQLVDGQVNTFFVDTTWMRFVSEIWMFLATQLVNK